MSSGTSSLGEALAWLDRHVNLEAIESGRAGRSASPTLDRIRRLVGVMGDPQHDYPVIHVTGTNGKGSTVRMATTILVAKGLSVGTYTSPHLEKLNERLAWNLEPIDDEALAEVLFALRDLEPFVQKLASDETGSGTAEQATRPTWFELMTAAGYRWFSDVAVEAAVVEVGLGGRWDATNVAEAAVAVVTNVELDHVEILGPTRQHIAAEKAGIIKPSSVVILGDTRPEVASVFESEAATVGATDVWRVGQDFACTANQLAVGGRLLDIRTPAAFYQDIFVPLRGAHQGANAACAVAAAEAFFGEALSQELVEGALSKAFVPGRMEVMGHAPLVVLDGAHNAAGAVVAGATVAEDFAAAKRVIVVMGCLRGRDPSDLISGLRPAPVEAVVACPAPSPRTQPASAVVAAAESFGIPALEEASVEAALGRAQEMAGEEDMVLVMGSLYVVGAARTVLRTGGA